MKNIKDVVLIVVFILYIITSYVCQETLLPTSINSLFLLAFLGTATLHFLLKPRSYKLNFSKWYLVFLLYALCSALLMKDNVFTTLYQMFVIFILTFSCTIAISSKNTLELTVIAYVVAAVALGILIIYHNPLYLLGNLNVVDGERLGTEETGNANIFTALMMFSGVFASWLALYKKNIFLRIFSLLSLLFILYLMALSGGRKTIVALIACTLYFVWKKGEGNTKKRIIAIVAICMTTYLLSYMMMNVQWIYDVVGYRFEGMLGFLSGRGESNVSSDDLRKRMIEIGLQGWMEKPLFGHGLDSFKFHNAEITGRMFYSHNNYVELLYDFGLTGFILYYIFIYKVYKKLTFLPKEYEIYSILGIGIIIELLFFDIGGISYYTHQNMVMLCIATIIASSRKIFRKGPI